MTTSDAIQVDAEVVEATALSMPKMPEVAFHPASIYADFDAMVDWATALKAVYESAEFSEDEQGYREAKAARAAIRTYIRDIDARRKAVKAEYSAPLMSFEARVKLVTGALGDAADACDEFVKGWEDAGKRRKYEAIETEYEEFAPLLVDVLPFRRFYDLMQQRGRKWGNKTPSVAKCIDEMQEDVQRIADDLEAVHEIQTGHPDVAERTFWQTLDVAEARRQARAADDEDERIAALKAEQERMRQESAPIAAPTAEAEEQQQEPPVFYAVADAGRLDPPPAPEPVGDWVLVIKGATEFTAHRLLDMAVDLCGSGSARLVKGSPMDAVIQGSFKR